MKISILTLFPELFEPFLKTSLIGRATEKKIIEADLVSFFNFAQPKERIDSPTFGPGSGMLIKPEIIQKAIENQDQKNGKSFKIFFSPQGEKLNQKLLNSLYQKIKNQDHLLLVSSRYEGIDTRVEEYYSDLVISVGDFVLMGGDLPAMCFLESFLRLFPGIVGKTDSVESESFSGPFVDYPQYTSPLSWKAMQVPEIIRSGNHGLIQKWREKMAALKTVKKHFEWLKSYPLNQGEKNVAKEFIPPHYAVLMHNDVLLKDKSVGTTSVTSLDLHDIARAAATYGLKNYFISTPLIDQQKVVQTLMDFWQTEGPQYNIHRFQAVNLVRMVNNLDECVKLIEESKGKKPILIATSAKKHNHANLITYFDQSKVWQEDRPVLFVFGTGHGLAQHILEKCDYLLLPIEGFTDFNHLSVRSACSIIFDRWLGINIREDKIDNLS